MWTKTYEAVCIAAKMLTWVVATKITLQYLSETTKPVSDLLGEETTCFIRKQRQWCDLL